MVLRPYQQQTVDAIRGEFAKGVRSLILCAPTGAGKTVMFTYIAKNAVEKGKCVMVVCDRKELIKQASEKMQAAGLTPSIIAPWAKLKHSNCYVASIDTLRNRSLPVIDLLIIDEAHKTTFDRLVPHYPDAYVIGATATPHRTGGQKALSETYHQIIEPVTIRSLIDSGYLVPARTISVREDFADVGTVGGEFNLGQLAAKFNTPTLFKGLIENYRKFADGLKTICFCVNVEHSIATRDRFREEGISAEHIDGTTPDKERAEILRRFKDGEFLILCNCGVLTTGYDEPSIQCVIVNRATMSLPLWLQMAGRGARLFEGKTNFVLIDQGANVYMHGLWQQDREWSLHKKARRGNGVAPVKECELCGYMLHASVMTCPECGAKFKKKEKKHKDAIFVEVGVKPIRGILKYKVK